MRSAKRNGFGNFGLGAQTDVLIADGIGFRFFVVSALCANLAF